MWTVNNTGTSQDVHRVFGSGNMAYEINDNLNLSYTFGLDVYSESNLNYANKGGKTGSVANRSGQYQTWNNTKLLHNHNVRLSGDYDISDKIGVTFTLGAESRRDVFDQNGLASTGQQVFNVLRHFNFAQNDEIQSFRERNILGIYAQTEWDYDRMVYLTLAARKDWVSNLAPQNASIAYPSAAVSVNPNEIYRWTKIKRNQYIKIKSELRNIC